jgi:hypothetical protein
MATFEEFLNERNITLKRRYTENHPAQTVGNSAKVRNAIIEALKDGKITVDEFNEIVGQHSSAPSKWTRGNKRFFKIEEDGVSLSKYGTKILNSLVTESEVNEGTYDSKDHIGSTSDGQGSNAEIYKKGRGYYVVVSGQHDYDFEAKNDKELINKLEEYEFDSSDILESAVNEKMSNAELKKISKTKEYAEISQAIRAGQSDYEDMYDMIDPKMFKGLDLKKFEEILDDWFNDEGMTYDSYADFARNAYSHHVAEITKLLMPYNESVSIDEGLNKSDVAYQLAIDYTGRTKPKITKLNKKRLEIKYGYKISPETVIDSIKKVHPEVELKHIEWSDKMSGGGFHIFDILESAITEARVDAKKLLKSVVNGETNSVEGIKLSKGMAQAFSDWLENSTYGRKFSKLPFDKLFTAAFNWGIERYAKIGELKDEFKELKTKAKAMKESKIHKNFSEFINESINEESYKLDESFTSKLTGIARRAKDVKDFVKMVFKHEKFKAFNTPKTQPDTYENFLKFIKGHYAMVQQYESNKIEEKMIYTSFQQFVNESVELNEALKSSKLRGLLTMKRGSKQILKAIYGFSKIELDKITDDQIIDIDPKLGKKADGLVVYYTTQEKDNPYADTSKSTYNSAGKIPANTILALGMGKDVAYIKRDYIKRKMTMSLTLDPRKSSNDIGINKEYRGWDASGIYNVKRVIDVADAAFVINTNALPNAKGKIEDRVKAKEGALAFKSDKEFKDANIARYREILQKRASELPIDKLVEDAIDDATKVMKDGLKNQEKNKYGELIAGVGADGRAYKLNDISNFINGLISDYERWSGYMATIEEAEAKYGKDSKEFEWEARYSQKESEEYAKRIKDKLAKLKKRNLAW